MTGIVRSGIGVLLVAMAVTWPVAAPAAPQSDLDKFALKKVGKIAPDTGDGKSLCVCLAAANAADVNAAGVLEHTIVTGLDGPLRVAVQCRVRRFDPSGASVADGVCTSWVPLAK